VRQQADSYTYLLYAEVLHPSTVSLVMKTNEMRLGSYSRRE